MNIDNQIWWSSAIALIGFIVSGIGLYSYRYFVTEKSKINAITASEERKLIQKRVEEKSDSILSDLKNKSLGIVSKIETESEGILEGLKAESEKASNEIKKLSDETNKASELISTEIREVKKSVEIKKSLRISAFDEIAKNVKGLINTLLVMYKKSVPETPPNDVLKFFEENYATKSWEYLDIDSNPDIVGINNFSQSISTGFNHFTSQSEIVLNRYRNVIDSDVLRIIHQLVYSDEFKYLTNLHTVRKSGIIQKPPILKAHSPYITDSQIQDIITLIKWCQAKEKEYVDYKIDIKFNQIYQTFLKDYSKDNLPNMVPPEVLKIKDKLPKIRMN